MTESVHWSWRSRAAAAFVVGYVAVQLLVPAGLLFLPRAQRFGWQMYSSAHPTPVLVALRGGGARDTLDIDHYLAFRRGDMSRDYAVRLAWHVCRIDRDVEAIEVRRIPDRPASLQPCR